MQRLHILRYLFAGCVFFGEAVTAQSFNVLVLDPLAVNLNPE
jgi:hypothetical protein